MYFFFFIVLHSGKKTQKKTNATMQHRSLGWFLLKIQCVSFRRPELPAYIYLVLLNFRAPWRLLKFNASLCLITAGEIIQVLQWHLEIAQVLYHLVFLWSWLIWRKKKLYLFAVKFTETEECFQKNKAKKKKTLFIN